MAEQSLDGRRVAILVADGFEQVEMTKPREALEGAGARTQIVSLKAGEVEGWNHFDKGDKFKVDAVVADAKAEDFDALLLPGGVANPDQLRGDADAVAFVKAFFDAGKPIASICHGPWTLIEAGAVKGRNLTSWHTLKTDLTNAGAKWVDEECVVDQGLVTSRKPQDIPAFNQKMIEEFAAGQHEQQKATAQ
jgi:protease I